MIVNIAKCNKSTLCHLLAGGTNRVGKFGLSKTQFPTSPGPELVNQKGFFRHLKMLTKNEIFDLAILVDSKMKSV